MSQRQEHRGRAQPTEASANTRCRLPSTQLLTKGEQTGSVTPGQGLPGACVPQKGRKQQEQEEQTHTGRCHLAPPASDLFAALFPGRGLAVDWARGRAGSSIQATESALAPAPPARLQGDTWAGPGRREAHTESHGPGAEGSRGEVTFQPGLRELEPGMQWGGEAWPGQEPGGGVFGASLRGQAFPWPEPHTSAGTRCQQSATKSIRQGVGS